GLLQGTPRTDKTRPRRRDPGQHRQALEGAGTGEDHQALHVQGGPGPGERAQVQVPREDTCVPGSPRGHEPHRAPAEVTAAADPARTVCVRLLSVEGRSRMIDHITVNVGDVQAAKGLYEKALAPLGYSMQMEFEGGAGFGSGEGMPDFWLGSRGER